MRPRPEHDDTVYEIKHLAHVVADQNQRLSRLFQGANDVFPPARFPAHLGPLSAHPL